MTEALLGILNQVLKLGVLKESHKYADELKELTEAWYEEFQKSDDEISDNALDDIDLKLRILSAAIEQALRDAHP